MTPVSFFIATVQKFHTHRRRRQEKYLPKSRAALAKFLPTEIYTHASTKNIQNITSSFDTL